ncbi:MAG: polyprenyl synthetase family protein [Patescibacteria group bacterium]
MSSKTNKSLPSAIKILDTYKMIVWSEIEKYLHDPSFPPVFKIPRKYRKEAQFHWKVTKEYPKRKGKYLRPTLLMLTCEAMGGKPRDALKTAAAIQVSEDWLLIHDDFEDNSWQRRGKPTLHRMYGPGHAINAGDTLHIIMWKILIDNEILLGARKSNILTNEFYRILVRTTLGQSAEIKWTIERKNKLSDKDWFFIADGKTSYYTIAGPMMLGAIIADTNTVQLDLLAKFGSYLGRSFQLVDDVLDLTSDFSGLKMQSGNDIYEGKRTVILGHLLRSASPKDKKKLLSILKKPREEKTKDEVGWVIEKMHHYGSIKYARVLAKRMGKKAFEIFNNELKFLSHQPARKHLEHLFKLILERDY